ncbi:hypothetical protein BOTCAL_0089g00240 [Botryotinia calthae]|uniref:Uncharacterized protein n=1 Tax=Botryotinia calthae TaxID=38488 RepID=A0A4Y8D752_9HELO|nr:hypothetical protein BOTCAL_0089g00240 [Botryotinia calthae]
MSQSLYYDLENSSMNFPTPRVPTSEASNTESRIDDSSNIQTSSITISDSSRELPQENSTQEFPQYDNLPVEIKYEIMYQFALQSETRIIPVDIQTRLLSPTTRRPSDQIEALLKAGAKWNMQDHEFQYVTLTRGCGWHAREQLTLDEFYFRPEKDILWFSEEFLENYQNINIYPPESVKRLAISYRDFRSLLILFRGQLESELPRNSSLFIGKLPNLEHIYVVPHSNARKENFNENSVLVDSDLPDFVDRDVLRMWWLSWLEKDSGNVGWKAPELSFKEFQT